MSRNIDLEFQQPFFGSQRVATCLGLFASILLVFGIGAQAQSGFQVVVHPDSSISSLPREAVSRLFLKKDKTWAEGGEAIPVDQTDGAAVREAFSKTIHGRGSAPIQRYWQKQLFSGEAVPPAQLASDAAVIDFVKSNPGAIGYVASGASVQGVKVLTIAEAETSGTSEKFPPVGPGMTPPRLLKAVDPEYPVVARRARYECAVTVKANINKKGKVKGVQIVESCDRFQRQLDESTSKAVRRWTFEPALDTAGKPTPVSYSFQVWFTL